MLICQRVSQSIFLLLSRIVVGVVMRSLVFCSNISFCSLLSRYFDLCASFVSLCCISLSSVAPRYLVESDRRSSVLKA